MMDPLHAYPTTLDPTLQPLVACLGYPVAGDPTQFAIERGVQAAGLDWRIVTASVQPDQLTTALAGLRAMQFNGLAILPPHRAPAAGWMDRLGPVATDSGQVTVGRRHEALWLGEDTRAAALAHLLESRAWDTPALPLAVLEPDLYRWLRRGWPAELHSRIWSPAQPEPTAAEPTSTHSAPPPAAPPDGAPHPTSVGHADGHDAEHSAAEGPASEPPAGTPPAKKRPGSQELDSLPATITLAGLISLAPPPSTPPEWLKNVQWTEQPLWICMEELPASTAAPSWLSRLRPKRLPPEWLRLHQAAVDFKFWTGQLPPEDVLREAFDEFLDL
jgi:hypothetical protein